MLVNGKKKRGRCLPDQGENPHVNRGITFKVRGERN